MEVQNEFHISCILARFGLQWPRRVIVALRKNLLQLDPATSDEVVEVDGVAVPHGDGDLTESFDEGDDGLLLKDWMFPSICTCPGAVFGGGIFEAYVGILP